MVSLGKIGLNFLNIIPKLGKVVYVFFGDLFTDIFNAIYNQQLDPKKQKRNHRFFHYCFYNYNYYKHYKLF